MNAARTLWTKLLPLWRRRGTGTGLQQVSRAQNHGATAKTACRAMISAVVMGAFGFAEISAAGVGVVEIDKPVSSAAYRECMAAVSAIPDRKSPEAIRLLENSLEKVANPYERYQIVFRELSFRYADTREWQKLFDLLRQGQREGLFYPFQHGENPWPSYVAEIGRLEGFDIFRRENDRLRNAARVDARLEYFVEVPEGYARGSECPLVMVFHGGVGSHRALAENWHSSRMTSDCLVACVQGAGVRGSFSRTYEDDDFAGPLAVYRQILARYSVDTNRIVLAGQSNGGRSAIQLAVGGRMPVKGLILAFPTRPARLDEPAVRAAAARGLRAVFLCGEKDGRFRDQKEMVALFDRGGVPHQFRAFPEKGHEFPDGFPAHLDRSLEFLLGR
jgi:dienelactone hydrolase